MLVPLRLDSLGAGGIAVGAAFLIAAATESFVRPAIGKLSDRHGRMCRSGRPVASPLAALLLPLPDYDRRRHPRARRRVLAMSLIWTPAMALLSDDAETAGLDLAFATALVSLAWAGGQVVGGSAGPAFADATHRRASATPSSRRSSSSPSRYSSARGASRQPNPVGQRPLGPAAVNHPSSG